MAKRASERTSSPKDRQGLAQPRVAPAADAAKEKTGRRGVRTEATRRALIDATVSVIGQSGYAEASIARITAKAGVAQGTFYNYFSSQQDLFDQVLPLMGQEMLERVRERRRGQATALDKEQAGFQAFFDYLLDYPEFYRVLNEAETFAPRGYRQHIDNMVGGYVRSLARARANGELGDFDERELEVVAHTLIAARLYLAMRYTYGKNSAGRIPSWAVEAYMKLLRHGLFNSAPPKGRRRGAARVAKLEDQGLAKPVVLEVGENLALLSLDLETVGVDPSGRSRRALLSDLVEMAAAHAIEADGLGPFLPFDLSLRFVRPPMDGPIFARAHCLDRGGSIALASVELRQDSPDGPLVASAQLGFQRQ